MATWDFTKGEDKSCLQCGSVYAVTHHQVPVKDIDSVNCEVCGHELDRWKSTRFRSSSSRLAASGLVPI